MGYRSNELASAAQAWTDKCAYGHGGGKAVDAGENIAAYFGGGSDVAGAIGMWSSKSPLSSRLFTSETDFIGLSRSFSLDEAKDYNWGAPAYNGSTGHFTQQVCYHALVQSMPYPKELTDESPMNRSGNRRLRLDVLKLSALR